MPLPSTACQVPGWQRRGRQLPGAQPSGGPESRALAARTAQTSLLGISKQRTGSHICGSLGVTDPRRESGSRLCQIHNGIPPHDPLSQSPTLRVREHLGWLTRFQAHR